MDILSDILKLFGVSGSCNELLSSHVIKFLHPSGELVDESDDLLKEKSELFTVCANLRGKGQLLQRLNRVNDVHTLILLMLQYLFGP